MTLPCNSHPITRGRMTVFAGNSSEYCDSTTTILVSSTLSPTATEYSAAPRSVNTCRITLCKALYDLPNSSSPYLSWSSPRVSSTGTKEVRTPAMAPDLLEDANILRARRIFSISATLRAYPLFEYSSALSEVYANSRRFSLSVDSSLAISSLMARSSGSSAGSSSTASSCASSPLRASVSTFSSDDSSLIQSTADCLASCCDTIPLTTGRASCPGDDDVLCTTKACATETDDSRKLRAEKNFMFPGVDANEY
mmetsp:Transcript_13029/g.26459  ORF Transcript_13029/g.26459 Transcript_13029/m.26459 type:complete len:253 (-) Transcript_13029:80-838(-)